MKKLMIAAALAAMSVALNAATFTWKADGYNSQDWNGGWLGEDGARYMAYLWVGDTVTASSTAFNFGTALNVDQSPQNPDSDFGATHTTGNGNLASDAAGQEYSIVIVEDNGKGLSAHEGHYVILSGTGGHDADPMNQSDTWATFQNDVAIQPGQWQTMAVPEPTSGLLLLLGVAGLALRRRRA